jgi:bacterioferritin-associated ferredoxin
MIICICHRVADHDIARAAREGCPSFDELQFELSVATSCGKCHDCAHATFHRHAARAGSATVGGGAPSAHGSTARIAVIAHRDAPQVASA